MSPEKRLWQSVVVKALTDATAVDPSSDEDLRAKREADSWLRGGGKDFRRVCSLAGFDPDFIRDAYTSGRVDGELLRSKEPKGGAA